MQAAAHAQSPGEVDPPELLAKGWMWARWGTMDEAGGLLDQPMGLVDRVTTMINIYEAWTGFIKAGDSLVDWAERYPAHAKIVNRVRALREGRDGT